jgi:hypothetical protein
MLQSLCSRDSQFSYVLVLNLLMERYMQRNTCLLIRAQVTLLESQIIYLTLVLKFR